MRKFSLACVVFLAMIFVLNAPLDAKSKCKQPPQGPPGPPGPSGPPGPVGSLATSYASSFAVNDDGLQIIPNGVHHFPLSFPREQVKPVGIKHPLEGNSSLFQIQNRGIYLVGWSIRVSNTSASHVSTVLILDGVPSYTVPPQDTEITTPESTITLSGQTIIPLSAGSTLQLGVSNETGVLSITAPSLYIMQIAK